MITVNRVEVVKGNKRVVDNDTGVVDAAEERGGGVGRHVNW